MSAALASAGRGEEPPEPGEAERETALPPGSVVSVSAWGPAAAGSRKGSKVSTGSRSSQETPRVRRGSLCSVGSVGSCVSIMQRVEQRLSSAACSDAELSAAAGYQLRPGSPKLARLSRSQRPQRPGCLSLRGLLVSALVGTAALACGAMLALVEAAASAGQEGLGAVRAAAGLVGAGLVLGALGLGLALSAAVGRPMANVARLAELLNEPDLARRSDELGKLRARRRSWIQDVGELQETCYHLSRGVEMFMRYVPDAVVRSIVRGDESAMRLHVFRRKVTIMFADIKDFTAISESLSQEDLLYVLTRYLSIMTKVVESYQGVVAEILGDGLLVFWNTPDDVPGHEAKACAAAMAQQQVLVPLNNELKRLRMPAISTRIGLHTGQVLSGTIGSETKMKFGCLGDPVNLASRLEGLCKVYGVSVICSDETHRGLPEDSGFLCRQLDLVQVKGKKSPTRIYEVVGFENYEACLENRGVRSTAQSAMRESTQALRASNVLQVNPIRHQRSSFFRLGSYNLEELAEATGTARDLGADAARPMSPALSMGSVSSRCRLWDTISPEAFKHVELYERALREYQQANFAEAQTLFKSFLEQLPEDRAATLLLERINRYLSPESGEVVGLTGTELAEWTGVTAINEK